jgi:hypothetical protein
VIRVVIAVDPHKLSATFEAVHERQRVLAGGRFGTDRDGYRQLLAAGRRWSQRLRTVRSGVGVVDEAPAPVLVRFEVVREGWATAPAGRRACLPR